MRPAKKRKQKPLPNGRSAPKTEWFLRLPMEMLKHPKFRNLNSSAVCVLLAIGSRFCGTNNGKIYYSCNELAKDLHISKSTACVALAELREAGFLVRTKAGYYTGRKASEWEVTFLDREGYPPSQLWKDPEQRPRRPWLEKPKKDLIQSVIEDWEISTEIERKRA